MILFPAIDLIDGKVVRLERGERARMKVYSDDPQGMARAFVRAGAAWVHVVDLSSALGEGLAERKANARAIEAICGVSGLQVDVGGGVKNISDVRRLANLGCSRVAVGTALVTDPDFAASAVAEFGEMMVADFAARDGVLRIKGWRDASALSVEDMCTRIRDLGFSHAVFTDIAKDGMQTGIDVGMYRRIAALLGFAVVASGGIARLQDIAGLAREGTQVIEGAITGRAMYEGNFSLSEALAVAAGTDAFCTKKS